MPIFKLGFLIKAKREELGYTQEELADGVCSVATLSRIENGERLPTKDHFETLLQRLGYSDTVANCFVDEHTFFLHELRYKIHQAVLLNKHDIAKQLFNDYQENVRKITPMDQQFMLLIQTIIFPERFNTLSKLDQLQNALKLTCPQYCSTKVPSLLSFQEIKILICISECYFEDGNLNAAIIILFRLKQYYEIRVVNSEEVQRTQPIALCNLAKYLDFANRHDECIEICNLSIRIAQETGQCRFLEHVFFIKAKALMHKSMPGDIDSARESAKLALFMAQIMGNSKLIQQYTQFITSTFHDSTLSEIISI